MGISDWSSDVCSSELITLLDAEDRILIVGVIEFRPAGGDAGDVELQILRHVETGVRGDAAGQLRCVCRAISGKIVVRDAGRVGRIATAVGDLRRQACRTRIRSAEHTSELQSLMRISYAVF